MSFERCIKKDEDHAEIETMVHQSFLDDSSPQDCQTVVALILESLKKYHRQRPDVKYAWIKSDNAACYKNEHTIKWLWWNRRCVKGLEILGVRFSEPGKGKSVPDQVSAITKRAINTALKNKKDANSPSEMIECATMYGQGLANTTERVVLDTANHCQSYLNFWPPSQ